MRTYLTVVLVCFSFSLTAQKSSEEDKIREVQKLYDRAIEKKDSSVLRNLFYSKMIITGGDGTRRNAQAEIRDCVDPHYNVAYFRTHNIEVDIIDKTAILRGDIEWQLTSADQPPLTLNRRITFTYVSIKNQWKIVAQHIGMPPRK